jgi:hypothetical protein
MQNFRKLQYYNRLVNLTFKELFQQISLILKILIFHPITQQFIGLNIQEQDQCHLKALLAILEPGRLPAKSELELRCLELELARGILIKAKLAHASCFHQFHLLQNFLQEFKNYLKQPI